MILDCIFTNRRVLCFFGYGLRICQLKAKGLVVVPGKYFFPGQAELSQHADSCIRVSVVQDEASVQKGMAILAEELQLLWSQS